MATITPINADLASPPIPTLKIQHEPATPIETSAPDPPPAEQPVPPGSEPMVGTVRHSQIPSQLLHGLPMIKISKRKVTQRTVWLSAEGPSIRWDSKKLGVVRMDQIKEVRYGEPASPTYPIPGLTPSARARWIAIVYVQPPNSWKTLNIIALKDDDFKLWIETIMSLLGAIRGISVSTLPAAGQGQLSPSASTGASAQSNGPNGPNSALGNGGIIGITGDKESLAGMRKVERAAFWQDADLDGDEKVTFDEVFKMCRRMGIITKSTAMIEQCCREIDIEGKGYLNHADFSKLLKILKRQPEIEELYARLTADGPLDEKRFKAFLLDTQKVKLSQVEMSKIYDGLLNPERGGSESSLWSPIVAPPGSNFSLAMGVDEIEGNGSPPSQQGLTLDHFTIYLLSSENAVLQSGQRKVCQDMTRPLADYYISSSHNTYLVGHQWKSESTVEGYTRALLAGCRCVEVDLYDGEPEPLIYHASKKLTGAIPCRAVFMAIASYAFMASPYPVIISAELNCNMESQVQLVKVLKEVFGESLVTGGLAEFDLKGGGVLPSPEQLKYRIMFKCKRTLKPEAKPVDSAPSAIASSESSDTEPDQSGRGFFDRVTAKVAKLTTSPPTSPNAQDTRFLRRPPSRSSSLDSDSVDTTSTSKGNLRRSFSQLSRTRIGRSPSVTSTTNGIANTTGVVPELAAILVYTAGVKYRGFSKLQEYKIQDMFSVSEKTTGMILKETPMDFIKHNRTHLSRVYPKGFRTDSSNYLPHHFWALGAQIVAINWQTTDIGFAINAAMFARNGRSGYVLKPEILRSKLKSDMMKRERHIVQLNVFSGLSLPLPADIDVEDSRLYVEATLHIPSLNAIQDDAAFGRRPSDPKSRGSPTLDFFTVKTKVINGNAYNPYWKETLRFSFELYPELLDLAFLKIEVKHQITLGDDLTIANYCASLGTMEPGYRYLPLFDQQMSQYLFSTLFVRLDLS